MPKYEFHEFASMWSMLEGDAFEDFATDIAAHGLRVPIVLYQDKILDGRNRYRGCEAAGVEPRFVQADAKNDDEALELVWSLNDVRRHDSLTARAFAAEKYASLKHGQKTTDKRSVLSNERTPSYSATIAVAAAKFNVGVPSIADARAIRKYAPELEAKVVKGVLALREAATEARAIGQGRLAAQAQVAPVRQAVDPSKPVSIFNPIRGGIDRHAPLAARQAGRNIAIAPAARRNLTRQDVDPEFIGSDLDFVREYGHVWIHTAEERATMRFEALATEVGAFANKAKSLQRVDANWLRSPNRRDVERLRRALEAIEALVEESKRLLVAAERRRNG